MVARGVGFPDLAERLKGHYLRAAQDRAEAEGKVTQSRLSVMTGLQRRDIARLSEFDVKPPRPNPLTRLVALWRTDPLYAHGGQPLALPRTGPAPSFEALGRAVRQDVHPRTFLDALDAAGTVRIDGDSVTLIETAYVPTGGSAEQLAYLAENTGDHLAAAAANVLGQDPPFFERALHYSRLTPDQAASLAAQFARAQMGLLEELSRRAEAMQAENGDGAKQACTRIRAGGYVFTETADDGADPTETGPTGDT
jgi:hypothetical protein